MMIWIHTHTNTICALLRTYLPLMLSTSNLQPACSSFEICCWHIACWFPASTYFNIIVVTLFCLLLSIAYTQPSGKKMCAKFNNANKQYININNCTYLCNNNNKNNRLITQKRRLRNRSSDKIRGLICCTKRLSGLAGGECANICRCCCVRAEWKRVWVQHRHRDSKSYLKSRIRASTHQQK